MLSFELNLLNLILHKSILKSINVYTSMDLCGFVY